MKKLVDTMGKDPDMLASLRRSVFDIATEGAKGGGGLRSFIENNEKSLRVLFGGTTHLQDLKTLADLQRRVNAFANVTGQIPEFESLDESLKRVFGFGVQFATTTGREAFVGRIAPETGALALMVRMAASLENNIYNRVFTKALEDEQFAKTITKAATPQDGQKILKQLQGIGISKEMLDASPALRHSLQAQMMTGLSELPRRGLQQEAARVGQFGQEAPVQGMAGLPTVPKTTASQMLRNLPPAPPTRGYEFNPRLPTQRPAAAPSQPSSQVPLMYPAMFPNDPISALLQQRQAAMQPQQPQQ